MTGVAVVDVGLANIRSLVGVGEHIGVEFLPAERPEQVAGASRVILPGVGNFAAAMHVLDETGWSTFLREGIAADEFSLLGICLGMQLLAVWGQEGGGGPGLGLLAGTVERLTPPSGFRVPHVGWNDVHHVGEPGLFAGVPQGTDFYFVHSFAVHPPDPGSLLATTDYGGPVTAAFGSGSVAGVQFHPEKSSGAGLRLLRNFVDRGLAC